MRKVACLLCPAWWTLSGEILWKKEKLPLSLEAANHNSQGKLLQSCQYRRQAEAQKARIPMQKRPPRKKWTGEQTSHRYERDNRIFPGVGGDLEKVCKRKPVKTAWLESKTLQDRRDSLDFKPLTLTFHQADMSS